MLMTISKRTEGNARGSRGKGEWNAEQPHSIVTMFVLELGKLRLRLRTLYFGRLSLLYIS